MIIRGNNKIKVPLHQICSGECFIYNNIIYLATSDYEDEAGTKSYIVSLQAGILTALPEETIVEPIKTELIILD